MTHVTIERAKLEQILGALNSPAYGKELRELQEKAIATCQQALAAPVPLTDEQREEIAKGWRGRNWTLGDIIDATEAAHGITKGSAT